MALKFLISLSFIALASAGLLPAAQVYHAAPQVYHAAPQVYHAAPTTVVKTVAPVAYAAKTHEEYDAHPQYKFGYDVQDPISGDSKSQVEERDGDVVHGEYSLVDADGYKRTVQYTSDPIHGFQAEVHREPLNVHYAQPAVVKSVAPVAHYAEPTLVKTIAPVTHYAAPALVKAVQPVTHYSAPTVVKTVQPIAHYAAPAVVKSVQPITHYSAPAVVKAVQPVTHYSAPAVVKTISPVTHYSQQPVAHYSQQPVYTSYSAPASYVTQH